MRVVVHAGMVWVYRIAGGWYTHLRCFPEAIKRASKDEYVPDLEHASVVKFVKENS